jgi:hypothetical protein
MTHGGMFSSVTLREDGSVDVKGPFTVDASEQRKPALISFYLIQDGNMIDGEGRWTPGQREWSGTGGSGLHLGLTKAAAFAVLALDNPPAFVTFSWSDEIEVKAAQPSG